VFLGVPTRHKVSIELCCRHEESPVSWIRLARCSSSSNSKVNHIRHLGANQLLETIRSLYSQRSGASGSLGVACKIEKIGGCPRGCCQLFPLGISIHSVRGPWRSPAADGVCLATGFKPCREKAGSPTFGSVDRPKPSSIELGNSLHQTHPLTCSSPYAASWMA
jgi:hypothetical protein